MTTEFPFENPEQFADVRTIAERAGVLLVGDEGQPFHHERRMDVRAGIFGPDLAECECGLVLLNMASPHVNGGYSWDSAVYEDHGNAMWTFRAPAEVQL